MNNNARHLMQKHIYFDFDSTLVGVETLDELARVRGVFDEVKKMTDASMNGEVRLEDVMPKKMAMIKPTRGMIEAFFAESLRNDVFVAGARELVARLREDRWVVRVLTANFHEVVDPFARHLNINPEDVFANTLLFHEDGSYAGIEEGSILLTSDGKGRMLQETRAQEAWTVFVGDSVSDLSCKGVADRMIGFGGVVARPRVQAEADVFVADASLMAILPHLLSA